MLIPQLFSFMQFCYFFFPDRQEEAQNIVFTLIESE